jgi:hypothetical protein
MSAPAPNEHFRPAPNGDMALAHGRRGYVVRDRSPGVANRVIARAAGKLDRAVIRVAQTLPLALTEAGVVGTYGIFRHDASSYRLSPVLCTLYCKDSA